MCVRDCVLCVCGSLFVICVSTVLDVSIVFVEFFVSTVFCVFHEFKEFCVSTVFCMFHVGKGRRVLCVS